MQPRFRQDLVAESIDDGGHRFVDVMAPDSGSMFRFYEVEFAIACGLDGERDVGGLVRWARDELGLTVAANEANAIISTLGQLGYLEGDGIARAAAPVAVAPIADTTIPTGPPVMARPGARGEDDLAPGIVVGGARPAIAPVSDIELGHVGARAPVDHSIPEAPDYGLGQPGAARRPGPPGPPVEDVPLGASGRSSDFEHEAPTASAFEDGPATAVSMDLSADMAINPADVKEAVRQSQVMRAVDVPAEFRDEIEAPAREPQFAPMPTPVPRPMVEAPREMRQPEPRPRPTPRPDPRASEPRPEPARGVSPWLLVALVVVIVGAGAFAVWKFVLQKSDEDVTSEAPKVPVQPAPTPKPAPPPAETATLAAEPQTVLEIKPTIAQTLEAIPAKDVVKKGDVVAYFVGHVGIEKQIAALQKDMERVQRELDDATKKREAAGSNAQLLAGAEAQVKNRQQSLDDKRKTFATRSAELEKYVLLSPADGKLVAVAKPNTRVTPDDVVARIDRAPLLVATLKSAANAPSTASVIVKSKDASITCRILDVDAKGAKIACPGDAATANLAITFDRIDTTAPAPAPKKDEPEIEMGEAALDDGSAAAGSAAKP